MEDTQTVSDKLDKLATDVTAALATIQAAVADLKAALVAAQGQTSPDLTVLGDKVDAIDQAVTTAAAAFAPAAPTT